MSPKKKKEREKKADEKKENEDDQEVKVEKENKDKEVEEEKEKEDEEVEEKKEKEDKEAEEEVMKIVENKQVTDEESEELSGIKKKEIKSLKRKDAIKRKESPSKEEKSPKKTKMEEQVQEKNNSLEDDSKEINVKNGYPNVPQQEEEDFEDLEDFEDDDVELKYDSDGSIIDDDEHGGVMTHSSNRQLTPEEKQKLKSLFIKLKHKVPPQHKVEQTAGTRVLNNREREEFEQYAALRTGKYLPYENKTLRRNWKDFCITNNWDINNPRPFLQMRHKNKVALIAFRERMKFIQFLANGLNNRSLYSVFNRFKVLYNPHKVSRYSSAEDDIIIEFIRKYQICDGDRDRKFAELALILKRTRASVWRRYRVLKRKLNIQGDVKKKVVPD